MSTAFATALTAPPSRFAMPSPMSLEATALHAEILSKAAEMEALFNRARDLRYPPVLFVGASIQMETVVVETIGGEPIKLQVPRALDAPHDATTGLPVLEPGEITTLEGGACVGAAFGPDYFGQGLTALELAVAWFAKGLTA